MSDDQLDETIVTMDRLTLMKCRYIVSDIDGINTLYCGKDVHKIPYCKDHYGICYRKARPAPTKSHKQAQFVRRGRS